ncbi:MAG: SRPBCC domain-containing protein [Mucilaginibacter sp.]
MNSTVINKDLPNKKLKVTRHFNAPIAKIWEAWTNPALLEKWWGPKPWTAVTKTMDFKAGGLWLYKMTGPDGEGQWCRVDIHTVDAPNGFTSTATFSDEDGVKTGTFPDGHWNTQFFADGDGTRVEATLTFDTLADMEQLVAMGFEQGFTMGLNQLEELLAQ